MPRKREFKESRLSQGVNERIAWTVDTAPWGGYSSGAAAYLYLWDSDADAWTDVSSTKLSGSPSESGGIITTPLVIDLVAGEIYKLIIRWVYSGNTLEAYGFIDAED